MHRRRGRGVDAQQQFEIARSILHPHTLTPCLALVLSHSLQSDGTLTEHTVANTHASTRITRSETESRGRASCGRGS
jgi:hypothetical protein